MCGIVCIVHNQADAPVDRVLLQAMSERLRHRGPDDAGLWVDDGVGLGHQRLSVIDIAGGHQPMTTADEGAWITYNGEVYNYVELRAELEAGGATFRTRSDTEVVLAAYREFGDQCVERFNGMFAFAVWDVREQRLFAARDRIGIKPLYYYDNGDVLLLASEIKSLLLHPAVRAEIDGQALRDYLDLQYCLGDRTLFKGIRRLLPGHRLSWRRGGGLRVERYWDLDFTPAETTPAAATEALQALLHDAVRLRLRSDVPVGTHLSGGMDSSAVASLAAEQLDGQLSVFTGGFRDAERYDESRYAKLMATHIGATYHEVFPTAQDLATSFEDMVYYLDEPVAGAAVFPQFFLSRLAAEHVKVVLGGQGGDELFCGYTRYLLAYLERSLGETIHGGRASEPGVELADLVPQLSHLRGWEPTLQRFMATDLFGDAADRYYLLLQRSDDVGQIVAADTGAGDYTPRDTFREDFERPQTGALIDRMTYVDLKHHLQSLLHLEDRTSMAVSLESRLPLLDHRLVEFVCSVPAPLRFAGGEPKRLLREALRGRVPDEILSRKDKMGFPVPIYEWFRDQLRPFVEDVLLGPTSRQRGFFDAAQVERAVRSERPFGRTVWGLVSMELWFRRFFDAS